ncbi:uncharacterized protein [Ranitomeya imitator]|uniref:uncharacterized protein n=1 Tax=Ranitomeya imitator TaxID=111125 RepID=UPI0037E75A8C
MSSPGKTVDPAGEPTSRRSSDASRRSDATDSRSRKTLRPSDPVPYSFTGILSRVSPKRNLPSHGIEQSFCLVCKSPGQLFSHKVLRAAFERAADLDANLLESADESAKNAVAPLIIGIDSKIVFLRTPSLSCFSRLSTQIIKDRDVQAATMVGLKHPPADSQAPSVTASPLNRKLSHHLRCGAILEIQTSCVRQSARAPNSYPEWRLRFPPLMFPDPVVAVAASDTGPAVTGASPLPEPELAGSGFLVQVRDIPCIWDAADVSYKDKYFRDHCWTKIVRDLYPEWDSLSIANQLEIEKNVKQRWRSVRDRYNKFINTCDRSGSSPSRITFPFYDELQFLLTSRTLRRTEGNLSNPPPVDDHSEDGAGTDGAGTSSGAGGTIFPSLTTASAEAACPAAAAGTSTAAAVGSSGSSEAVVTEKRAPYPVAGESIKKKKKKNEDKTEKMASDTLDLLKQSSSEDQCDFFALTIARKARSLPPDRQSLFMSLCQTSLTALEDPAPIESYENVLTGVFGLFRPRPKPSEPHYRVSSYTQPAQNFSGGGNTSLGPSASQSFMTDTSSSYGCSQEYTYLH